VADDGTSGEELWISDGTPEGTLLLKDIEAGTESSYPGLMSGFATMNGKVYFGAFDSVHGYELWESDGTTAGTQLVADVFPGDNDGYPNGSFPYYLMAAGNMLIFSAEDETHGIEPWVLWDTGSGEGGLGISPATGRLVAPDLPTAGFSLWLLSPPASGVTVTLSASNTAAVLDPHVVTFTTGSWQTPQTVSVGSTLTSGKRDFTVSAAVTSSDPSYQESIPSLIFVDMFPWYNVDNPLDTNKDTHITPIDALIVINYLNAPTTQTQKVGQFLDVTKDEVISPLDALRVINELNKGGSGEGEAEGEGALILPDGTPSSTLPAALATGMGSSLTPMTLSAQPGPELSATTSPSVLQLPVASPVPVGLASEQASPYIDVTSSLTARRRLSDLESTLSTSTTTVAGEDLDLEEWRQLLLSGRHRR